MNEKMRKRLEEVLPTSKRGIWLKGKDFHCEGEDCEINCRIKPLNDSNAFYYGIYPFSSELAIPNDHYIPCCYYNENFYLSEHNMNIDESDSALLQSALCFAEGIELGISIALDNEKDKSEPIPVAMRI
jgi:hypothetical protein